MPGISSAICRTTAGSACSFPWLISGCNRPITSDSNTLPGSLNSMFQTTILNKATRLPSCRARFSEPNRRTSVAIPMASAQPINVAGADHTGSPMIIASKASNPLAIPADRIATLGDCASAHRTSKALANGAVKCETASITLSRTTRQRAANAQINVSRIYSRAPIHARFPFSDDRCMAVKPGNALF